MFVCLCNALRERDCHAAAAHPDTKAPACVYRRLNCQVRCGACVGTMHEIISYARENRAEAAADPVIASAMEGGD